MLEKRTLSLGKSNKKEHRGMTMQIEKLKEYVQEELAAAVATHKSLCASFPTAGSMVDKASYIVLGRIEALEKVLKEMEK